MGWMVSVKQNTQTVGWNLGVHIFLLQISPFNAPLLLLYGRDDRRAWIEALNNSKVGPQAVVFQWWRFGSALELGKRLVDMCTGFVGWAVNFSCQRSHLPQHSSVSILAWHQWKQFLDEAVAQPRDLLGTHSGP